MPKYVKPSIVINKQAASTPIDLSKLFSVNKSLASLKKDGLCTDCFKQEAQKVYQYNKFDARAFMRDSATLENQVLDLARFKYGQ